MDRMKTPAEKMLYTLTLTGAHASKTPARMKNPFTGGFIDVPQLSLTDTERAAAKGVLVRYGAKAKTGGLHLVQLVDGTAVEVVAQAKSKPEPWTVSFSAYLQSLSQEALQFLFDLCKAGSFILNGDDVGIVTSAKALKGREEDGFVLVPSQKELGILLKEGIGAYRKHLARKKK
jgi:hypothetical protein